MQQLKRITHCSDCPHHHCYSNTIPLRAHGISVHQGEHYCLPKGQRKGHIIKARQYASGIPGFCPQKGLPAEIAVYSYAVDSGYSIFSDTPISHPSCYTVEYRETIPGREFETMYDVLEYLAGSEGFQQCGYQISSFDIVSVKGGL